MKFLIIIPTLDLNLGGMERFVIELSTRLTKLGHEITILTGKTNKPINIENVKIIRKKIFFPKLFNKPIKYIHLSFLAKHHLKKNKYDYVLAMGLSGIFLKDYIWRASGSPIPLIRNYKKTLKLSLISKIILFFDLLFQEYLEKKCVLKAKYHMFPSEELKREFEKSYSFKSKRYFIPCSGTLNIKIKNKKISKKNIKILTVGGLTQESKGSKIILEALDKTKDLDIKLIVVGKIKVNVPEHLKELIIEKGEIPYYKMETIYKESDIFIFPSFIEGFPNALLEAASFGLPIISSNIKGINEYFKHNKDIYILEKNDSVWLAEAIKKLIDYNTRKTFSKNIVKKAQLINYLILTKNFIDFLKNNKNYNLLKKIKK
ncbi:MAG: glycosyltransferase family 4 protein [Candidatus Woesearchaeota archaeon]